MNRAVDNEIENDRTKPHLSLRFVSSTLAVWLATSCALFSGASAQGLADPTRPPAGAYAIESADNATAGPVLQSVIITPTARTAIIGGESVKLNGKYGDARVIKITESEVVLRSSGGTETLKMYPGVDMKMAKTQITKPLPARKNAKAKKLPASKVNEK